MIQALPDHRVVAVEGLPGSGHADFVRWAGEQPDWSPELEDTFGQLPAIEKSALSNVLQRLVLRHERHQSLLGTDLFRNRVITDYLFNTHHLWAECLLTDTEWTIYRKVASVVTPPAVKIDLAVYFEAPEAKVVTALRARHRAVEPEKWRALYLAYQRFFFSYEDSPLIVVRTDAAEWFDGIGPREALWDKILSYRGGKTYFMGESGLWDGGTPAGD